MKLFRIIITGESPLFMHHDSVMWADEMDIWKQAAKSEGRISKAGDDRTPAHRWIGYLYHDREFVTIPASNMIACLMDAGKAFSDTTRGKGATLKRAAVTGVKLLDTCFKLSARGGRFIPMAEINPLIDVEDFRKHCEKATELGFDLDVRRVKIQSSKHIRVRPKFDVWGFEMICEVTHDQLENQSELERLLNIAGSQIGLGDWRPSSGSPGPYGRFKAVAKEVKS